MMHPVLVDDSLMNWFHRRTCPCTREYVISFGIADGGGASELS